MRVGTLTVKRIAWLLVWAIVALLPTGFAGDGPQPSHSDGTFGPVLVAESACWEASVQGGAAAETDSALAPALACGSRPAAAVAAAPARSAYLPPTLQPPSTPPRPGTVG